MSDSSPESSEAAESSEAPTVGLDPEFVANLVGAASAEFNGFIGTGQMSRNARFSLTWNDSETENPESVVVKIPSGDAGVRAISFEHRVYDRECSFYRSVAERVDITVPDCLAVHFDAQASDFVVVLEDLSGSEQGDQFREATTDELRLAIAQAAALQAPVWGQTDDAVFDPLRDDVEERAGRSTDMFGFFVGAAIERLGPGLDDDIVPLLQQFAAVAADWTRLRSVPTTLVHGDFRPDNFMFGTADNAPPIAVVDWQTVSLGLGVTDVAYLVAGALSPERRRTEEADLLAFYRAQLAERGVEYDADECNRDYALTSLHGIVIAVTATAMAERTERGDALFTLMINRHGRQALDLGALDLI